MAPGVVPGKCWENSQGFDRKKRMVSGDFPRLIPRLKPETKPETNPLTHRVSRKCLKRATAWLKPYAEQ